MRYLITLSDKSAQKYGNRVLDALRTMFKIIHEQEGMTEETFQAKMEKAKKNVLQATRRPPWVREARNHADDGPSPFANARRVRYANEFVVMARYVHGPVEK